MKVWVNFRLTRPGNNPTSKSGYSDYFQVQKVNPNLTHYILRSGWVEPFFISGRKSQPKLQIFKSISGRVIGLSQLLPTLNFHFFLSQNEKKIFHSKAKRREYHLKIYWCFTFKV